ncbi:hypothetical protein B0H11DRAFT_1952803 [Mycena galericulata]|nr:hypothetical protein B0H11DRAFT_1952803 [Mycena galericulata]
MMIDADSLCWISAMDSGYCCEDYKGFLRRRAQFTDPRRRHWLSHRVVLAPTTRYRKVRKDVHRASLPHYGQRANIPRSLLISEATFIASLIP